MSFLTQRKYERRPFVKPLKYYLTTFHIDRLKVKNIDCDGVSVDICEEGVGLITAHPITIGDILFFKEELKINRIVARSAIVRWVREIENHRYRAGLQFRMVRLS